LDSLFLTGTGTPEFIFDILVGTDRSLPFNSLVIYMTAFCLAFSVLAV
jgi:hypothetical protein